MYRFLIVLFSLYNSLASAGEVENISASHQQGTYFLELDATVSANQELVYRIATDDENLEKLNDLLIESTLLSQPGDPVKKRRMVSQTCVLFFCFKASAVVQVKEINNRVIITIVDPAQSDFDYGKTRWEITPNDDQTTHVHFQSELKPSFWIPPLIGPWAIKNKMQSEAKYTIEQLEKIAADE